MDKLHINLQSGQRCFFTSDPHYGHDNVIKFCKRPFPDSKRMNAALIELWNSVVTDNDVVFILGDFCWFTDRHAVKKIGKQLHGKDIYIIPGNHDERKGFELLLKDYPNWHLLGDVVTCWVSGPELPRNQIEVCLCHYPLMTWAHRNHGAIQLFGHIHSFADSTGYDAHLPLWAYQYDVGVDNNKYRPIEFTEILKKINWRHEDPMQPRKF